MRALKGLKAIFAVISLIVPPAGPSLKAEQPPTGEQSASDFDLLLKLNRQNAASVDYRLDLGDTAVRTGHYDFALTVYQKILDGMDRKSKPAAALYWRIGETYRRKGDLSSSLTALRKAKELFPANAVVLMTLAMALDQKGDRAAAALELKAALKSDHSKDQEREIKELLHKIDSERHPNLF